eukprot:NODE_119_length_18895_cov_0.454990.p8 type:complete len:101 gc:universal NODE_119_length_18895_cov_0.454990:5527-5829(+)
MDLISIMLSSATTSFMVKYFSVQSFYLIGCQQYVTFLNFGLPCYRQIDLSQDNLYRLTSFITFRAPAAVSEARNDSISKYKHHKFLLYFCEKHSFKHVEH